MESRKKVKRYIPEIIQEEFLQEPLKESQSKSPKGSWKASTKKIIIITAGITEKIPGKNLNKLQKDSWEILMEK